MTTPYSIADSLRQAIENSGYDIISAQEYYIKTDESEIIDEKRNYHIWNENISIDKLKADNYQLLLGTERERIGLGDLDRTIYLNFSMPSSKIKSKNIFFAGIRGWQNFMYLGIHKISKSIIKLGTMLYPVFKCPDPPDKN